MTKPPIYISLDIEADGPIPGVYSMISLGAAAFEEGNRNPLFTFEDHLLPLDDAIQDPATMAWWQSNDINRAAWEHATTNARAPEAVMNDFVSWIQGNCPRRKPVAVCYPATFDFMFVYWYLIRFCGASPFGFQALDLKSFASAKLGTPFREVSKRRMPKSWFVGYPPHTHKALDDAIGQGVMFVNMLQE